MIITCLFIILLLVTHLLPRKMREKTLRLVKAGASKVRRLIKRKSYGRSL